MIMNAQFCRVGRKTPSLKKMFLLKNLERDYLKFMEEAYNLMQSDMGLSDALYYEASKLKRRILKLKNSRPQYLDVGF